MGENDIFQLLSHEYYQFTSAEKRVADFIISNGVKAQTMSISELAEATGVAEATISRFCRRMGYQGYSAFRLAIAAATAARENSDPPSGEIQAEDTVPDLCAKLTSANIDAIRETQSLIRPENIMAAADALLAANTVLCMGQGGSMLMAEEAAHLFTTAFPGFFAVPDSHMQVIAAANLTEKDIILFFSYSGSTKELMDVLQIARQRHIRTILITRYPGSPGAGLADIVLQCGSTEGPLQLGSVAARIAQLYLIDVLFSEMCRRDLDTCRHRRELVADALSEKHV